VRSYSEQSRQARRPIGDSCTGTVLIIPGTVVSAKFNFQAKDLKTPGNLDLKKKFFIVFND
jgi:hypothetical protein